MSKPITEIISQDHPYNNGGQSWVFVGEAFEIYGGANHHGRGKQLALVHTITNQGNIYCYKFSMKGKLIAKKFKLDLDDVKSVRPDVQQALMYFFELNWQSLVRPEVLLIPHVNQEVVEIIKEVCQESERFWKGGVQ